MSAIRPKGERISVEEVRAAYELTKLRPVRACYFDAWQTDEKGERHRVPAAAWCGCPATAVAAARSGTPETFLLALVGDAITDEILASRALGLDLRYLSGFVNGVDDEPCEGVTEPLFTEGCADGAAVRDALWPAGGAA